MLAGVCKSSKFNHTPEIRKARSERMLKLWKDKDFRKRVSKAVSKAQKKLWKNPTPERKRHLRKMLKAAWSSGTNSEAYRTNRNGFRDKLNKNLSLGHKRPSGVQKKFFKLLKKSFPKLRQEYKIPGFRLDIADVQRKLDLEIDGVYWHEIRKPDSDKNRDKRLKKLGWKILRIKVYNSTLKDKDVERCEQFLGRIK